MTINEGAEMAGYGIGVEPADIIKKLDDDLAVQTREISIQRARLNHQEINVMTRLLYDVLMESKTHRELWQMNLRINELRKFILEAGLPNHHKNDQEEKKDAQWGMISHGEAFSTYVHPLEEAYKRRETEISAKAKIEKGGMEQKLTAILEETAAKAMKAISA